jgi:ribosome-associated translation inhibitor RaiA
MEHRIHITMNHVEPEMSRELRDYAERRLAFALRRFQQQIRNVRVRLVDLNGPKRGIDARCSVSAELMNGQRLFVEATTAWPFASVKEAAGRLSAALRRISSCNQAFHVESPSRRGRGRLP